MLFNRYGIYMTPKAEPLAGLGASWLGWSLENGSSVPHPSELETTLREITQTPRKYGFHGTIKPPFHLAEHTSYDALFDAAITLCEGLSPVSVKGFQIKQIGHFLALTPCGDLSPLANLAAEVLQGLDQFRAPPSEDELNRRRKTVLTPLQETNLKNWGYPYVLEEFNFHITLTGHIADSEATHLAEVAQAHFGSELDQTIAIQSLVLVGEAGDGRFHALHRLPLLGE